MSGSGEAPDTDSAAAVMAAAVAAGSMPVVAEVDPDTAAEVAVEHTGRDRGPSLVAGASSSSSQGQELPQSPERRVLP